MRARNIKPGFFKNEYLADLAPLTRILFQGLWCLADREGRLEDRPKKIKSEILPYDDCDVNMLLQELANSEGDFIIRYSVAGKKYIQILNFKSHQAPHQKESQSTIPAIPELSQTSTGNSGASTGNSGTSPADSFNLIPDSLNLKPDTENVERDSAVVLSLPQESKKYLDKGIEPELIIEAVNISKSKQKGWGYTCGILDNWTRDGIRSVKQLHKEVDKRKTGPPGKVPQELNYEQRKYDDDFYRSLYDNL